MALIGGAVVWPKRALAQSGTLPTIGFLGASTADAWRPWVAAFAQRLHELGWVDGRTVAIKFRWAEGRPERAADIAAEFIGLKVDVLVTSGALLLEAKQASSHFPTVLVLANDPVGAGFAQSLARPGGNVTGLSFQGGDIAGKRLDLLREVIPNVRRLAILVNKSNPGAMLEVGEVERAARILRLEASKVEFQRSEEIEPSLESLEGRVEAIYIVGDPLVNANRVQIGNAALGARLPTIHGFREPVEAGGLMSYGANFPDMFRRAAGYVDKILRGAKPAELPIEQPNKFDLVINLRTAKALGLKVSESLLLRADEVIE
jgi:putative tryptophan/tyrosine transport system substrate-binding protein